jgi:hypothetical protein
VAAAGLALALILTGVVAIARPAGGKEPAAPTGAAVEVPSHGGPGAMSDMTHGAGMVVAPAAPTDGVLTIIVPPGTDAAMKRSGDAGYHLPSVMRLEVGDTVVIRNDDSAPHMILYTFLMPGQSDTRVFTEPGSEVYSSGCSANAAEFHDFTTIFVRR